MKKTHPFFPNPAFQSEELTIFALCNQEAMPPYVVNRPGGTGDYLFMFFFDSVDILVGGKTARYPARSLMIWEPEDGHYYGNPDSPWTHSWLHCTGSWVTGTLRSLGIPIRTPTQMADGLLVDGYFQQIYNELSAHAKPDSLIVRNLFHNFLIEARRCLVGDEAGQSVPQPFVTLKRRLDIGYARTFRLADLAAAVHLSVPHFCLRFRQHFGVTPIEHVIRTRMEHAALLLRDRNLNVAEIGRRVGYDDIFYFSRVFKKRHGLSPLALRKQYLSAAAPERPLRRRR